MALNNALGYFSKTGHNWPSCHHAGYTVNLHLLDWCQPKKNNLIRRIYSQQFPPCAALGCTQEFNEGQKPFSLKAAGALNVDV